MGSYPRLLGEDWKNYLKEIMSVHRWSIARVAELTGHPRSIIGYWLAGKRVAYATTQAAVRATLEKEKLFKWADKSDKKELKDFLKKWMQQS